MNNSFLKLWSFIISIALLGALSACDDDDPPLPDNTVNFTTDAVGFNDDESAKTITLAIDRETTEASSITVNLAANGVAYGQQFTTEPAATGATLTLAVPAGSTEVSFKVVKAENLVLDGIAEVTFTASAATPLVTGKTSAIKLSFEPIISTGSKEFQLNGGTADGSGYTPNAVYVDFSSNTQTSIAHTAYDLAFYGGAEFRVFLNYTSNVTALKLDKTDIDAVTVADATGKSLTPGAGPGISDNIGLFDKWAWTSNLTETVIGEVSATEANNYVFLFKPTTPVGDANNKDTWYKIRVLRSANNGYTLQYARLGDTSHKSIDIGKNADYNFTFASLASGQAVAIEPKKANWDIVWSYAAYYTQNYAYAFNDFVLINNTANVTVVKVAATETLTYTSFSAANLTGLEFSNKRDAIGPGWRSTVSGIIKNQFYVVKDGAGNYYKLNFVSMGVANDGGTRGKPVIQYELVKKAG